MHELPLLLFTLLLQSSVGVTVWLALLRSRAGTGLSGVVLAFVMACMGLLASMLHMGYPLNALNALRHVASSWLSREIVFASLYLAALGLSGLLMICRKPGANLLLMLAAVIGVIDVYCMGQIYMHTSVITWQHVNTLFLFYGTSVIVGSVLIALMALKGRWACLPQLAKCAVAAVTIMVLARLLVQPLWFSAIMEAGQQIVTLPHAPVARLQQLHNLYIAGWIVSVTGLFCFAIGGLRKAKGALILGSGLLIIAEVVLRFIFFSIG
ncbi:dimethyl sulfoxide reductase [Superficieibacter electus]|uniref:Dimethyl sulfoxide reductase n=1 Tax=Superficieibacter electus TaxID=2022662 RepID=A0A2P5GKI8_9ENTR|nr:DmsC/YnfH family molybdoenzyme membrane anchor subunit [Superficieibacter electus]POP42508.1 dimethyl sulfoxide reductase [Superficieibacter electus]POP45122.1 dimethyl sulfoxide reductase [Superficieibacter electus]